VLPAPLSGKALLSKVSVSEATTMDSCQQQQDEAQHAATAEQPQQPDAPVAAAPRGRRASSRSRVSATAAGATQSQQQRTSRLQHSNTQQQQQPLQLDEQQLAALAAAAAELDAADAAPMFLERVVLWWCGVPSDAAGELQKMLLLYAGVRFPDLCDATTHIMVNSAHCNVGGRDGPTAES
jgi:pyruvate/2-oxoglutarate dehydrogenase complex dihydrolipoamide acyltransferase (E2) component